MKTLLTRTVKLLMIKTTQTLPQKQNQLTTYLPELQDQVTILQRRTPFITKILSDERTVT